MIRKTGRILTPIDDNMIYYDNSYGPDEYYDEFERCLKRYIESCIDEVYPGADITWDAYYLDVEYEEEEELDDDFYSYEDDFYEEYDREDYDEDEYEEMLMDYLYDMNGFTKYLGEYYREDDISEEIYDIVCKAHSDYIVDCDGEDGFLNDPEFVNTMESSGLKLIYDSEPDEDDEDDEE